MNNLRNHAIKVDSRYTLHSKQLYLDPATYATSKGPSGVNIVAVFSNQGQKGGKYELNVGGGFAPNEHVMEVLSCDKSSADAHGNITVQMGQGMYLRRGPLMLVVLTLTIIIRCSQGLLPRC